MFKAGRNGGVLAQMYPWERVLGDTAFTAEQNVRLLLLASLVLYSNTRAILLRVFATQRLLNQSIFVLFCCIVCVRPTSAPRRQ